MEHAKRSVFLNTGAGDPGFKSGGGCGKIGGANDRGTSGGSLKNQKKKQLERVAEGKRRDQARKKKKKITLKP